MQNSELHQAARRPVPVTHRRRGVALLGAGTLVLVLAATGITAALAGRSSPAAQKHRPSVAAPAWAAVAMATHQPHVNPVNPVNPVTPVLADGTYPTYIRNVDVRGARITVDVVQVFENDAAVAAAIEDGQSPSEAQSLYVYIRNQNSRLRTLPVARHLRISFADGCDAPPDRKAALTELAKATARFNSLYFYDITVRDGAIRSVKQKLAEAAC